MLLVVFYHCGTWFSLDFGYSQGETNYIPTINRIIMCMCSVSIPLFFMSSGYLMLHRKISLKKLLTKIIYIGVIGLFWNYITPFHWWFLATLSFLYFWTPFLQKLQDNKYTLLLILSIIFILSFGKNFLYQILINFDISPPHYLSRSGFFTLYSIIYYMFGGYIKKREEANKDITKNRNLYYFVFLLGLLLSVNETTVLTNYIGKMFDGVNSSFCTVGALLMSISIFTLLVKHPINSHVAPVIASASKNTLAIYILHGYLLTKYFNFIEKSTISFLYCLIASITVYFVAYTISYICKSNKYTKWLFSI